MKRHHRLPAISLAELLVVLAILTILLALVLPRFAGYGKEAKETAVLHNAAAVAQAAELYVVDCYRKGTSPASQLSESSREFVDAYLTTLPKNDRFTIAIDDQGKISGSYTSADGVTKKIPLENS